MSLPYETYETTGKDIVFAHTHCYEGLQITGSITSSACVDYGIIVSKYSILQLFHVYAIMVDTSVLQYYMGETDIER